VLVLGFLFLYCYCFQMVQVSSSIPNSSMV
jgi:hypothetical protein